MFFLRKEPVMIKFGAGAYTTAVHPASKALDGWMDVTTITLFNNRNRVSKQK
jgi:hypothetical protein